MHRCPVHQVDGQVAIEERISRIPVRVFRRVGVGGPQLYDHPKHITITFGGGLAGVSDVGIHRDISEVCSSGSDAAARGTDVAAQAEVRFPGSSRLTACSHVSVVFTDLFGHCSAVFRDVVVVGHGD